MGEKHEEHIQFIIEALNDERLIFSSVKNEQGLGMLPQLNITIMSKDPDLINKMYRVLLGQFKNND